MKHIMYNTTNYYDSMQYLTLWVTKASVFKVLNCNTVLLLIKVSCKVPKVISVLVDYVKVEW